MMESGSDSGAGTGPGRRGRLFDDLAGLAGGAFSMVSGLRAEVEAMARSQVELMVQRLELVRREDLDAALEVARRAREESTALAARVAALEAKLGGGASAAAAGTAAGATTVAAEPGPEPTESREPPAHAGGPRLADAATDKGGEGEPPAGLSPDKAAGSAGGDLDSTGSGGNPGSAGTGSSGTGASGSYSAGPSEDPHPAKPF